MTKPNLFLLYFKLFYLYFPPARRRLQKEGVRTCFVQGLKNKLKY